MKQFLLEWCEQRRLELHDIDALTVAAYVEQLGSRKWRPPFLRETHVAGSAEKPRIYWTLKEYRRAEGQMGIIEDRPACFIVCDSTDR
jgi:hypothetical protein